MKAYAHVASQLDANLGERILRATIGVGLTTTFLTGVWVTPTWIFTASVLALYLVVSAIVDKGLLDIVFKPETREAVQPPSGKARSNVGRLARGATAGVALGSVLGDAVIDAYVLDALDIFMLNVGGIFLAMTTLFRPETGLAELPISPVAGAMSGTRQVSKPEFDTKERAA